MARVLYQTVRVDSIELREFTQDVLISVGVPLLDAEYVAWHLVETNLRGTDSHGVARLPHYVARLQAGSIRAAPLMRVDRKGPSLAVVDGDHGLGHLVMKLATEKSMAIARETGAAWVSVCNSSHCGALAPFALRLVENGMVAFVFTHVDPMVLPHGGLEPFCGTNPLCIAVPGPVGRTLCLDMATSIVPWNVVANAALEAVQIPKGWGVDEFGCDTMEPGAVRALYPFGGYKGSGLGIVIDVLCALLSGAPYGPDIPKMYGDLSMHRRLGGLVGAIDVSAFVKVDAFVERVAEFVSRLGRVTPADDVTRVRFPGELEIEMKIQRTAEGVPLGTKVFAELNALATKSNVQQLASLP